MKPKSGPAYRIQEFAKLTGVTVRALRHYDRLGLLKPTARSNAGYRLYRDRDIARLQQIIALKAAVTLVMADRASWPGPMAPELRAYFDVAMKSA